VKIVRIKIENYRSIKCIEIKLLDKILLVGPNDHGKTNILKAVGDFLNLDLNTENETFYRKNKRRDSGSSPLRFSFVIDDLPPGLRHTRKKLKTMAFTIQVMANGEVKVSQNSLKLDSPKSKNNKKIKEKLKEMQKNLSVTYVPTFRDFGLRA